MFNHILTFESLKLKYVFLNFDHFDDKQEISKTFLFNMIFLTRFGF